MPTSRYFSPGVIHSPAGTLPTFIFHLTVCVARSIAAEFARDLQRDKHRFAVVRERLWLGMTASGRRDASVIWFFWPS